ncbi:DUF1127 domain-containing protein [Marinicellulosiphila megalodicopiae]|uniref:DUF1127 domain-containing protein n=1 Tax=Marinicellulosiphila megalodicopiae TaxID=2724896 RepID=UPI003BAFA944
MITQIQYQSASITTQLNYAKKTLNIWVRRIETRQQLKYLSASQLKDVGINTQQQNAESNLLFWK